MVSRTQQSSCTQELTAIVTACIRLAQAEARQKIPEQKKESECEIPPLAEMILELDSC